MNARLYQTSKRQGTNFKEGDATHHNTPSSITYAYKFGSSAFMTIRRYRPQNEKNLDP
jgi:hypothetical protein